MYYHSRKVRFRIIVFRLVVKFLCRKWNLPVPHFLEYPLKGAKARISHLRSYDCITFDPDQLFSAKGSIELALHECKHLLQHYTLEQNVLDFWRKFAQISDRSYFFSALEIDARFSEKHPLSSRPMSLRRLLTSKQIVQYMKLDYYDTVLLNAKNAATKCGVEKMEEFCKVTYLDEP